MNKSESISELAKALAKFNGEISKISKDAANPFFKNHYATLDAIIDEARPILTKNGLSILQLPSGDGENAIIKTLLIHESGEYIESESLVMKPVKNDPQAIGSCFTYMRRYSLSSFLCLNTGEDDDGNKATHEKGKPQPKNDAPPSWGGNKPPQAPPSGGKKTITEAQQKRLFAICTNHGVPNAEVKEKIAAFGFASSKDLDKATYDLVCEWAENYDNPDNFTMPEEE